MDLDWIALCLLFDKEGAPTLYFICHRCFSLPQQCPIVSMKISGSMQRRILYYYVPAKFRSLFSFCCSQRAHNLLSTMRQATKLHCCSANRLVLVDGLTRCEVCLSAATAAVAAVESFLGPPPPPCLAGPKKKNGQEGEREEGIKWQAAFLVSVYFPPFEAGKQCGWWGDCWSCCPATVRGGHTTVCMSVF